MLIKNCPNDPIVDVHDKRYVDEFSEIETCILDFMDVKYAKEVDDNVEQYVHNWICIHEFPFIHHHGDCVLYVPIIFGIQHQFND